MTLLEEIPTGRYREASIPVLETKRLALRAARLEDAKAVAALANDRRMNPAPGRPSTSCSPSTLSEGAGPAGTTE